MLNTSIHPEKSYVAYIANQEEHNLLAEQRARVASILRLYFFFYDQNVSNALENMAKAAHALGSIINDLLLLYPNPPLNCGANIISPIYTSYPDFSEVMKGGKKKYTK